MLKTGPSKRIEQSNLEWGSNAMGISNIIVGYGVWQDRRRPRGNDGQDLAPSRARADFSLLISGAALCSAVGSGLRPYAHASRSASTAEGLGHAHLARLEPTTALYARGGSSSAERGDEDGAEPRLHRHPRVRHVAAEDERRPKRRFAGA